MSDSGSATGLRESEQPRRVVKIGGLRERTDRRRDPKADSIARQAVKVFDCPEAESVSGEDLSIIISFLLDRGKIDELSAVMSHLTSDCHREVLIDCCFRELSYDFRQGKLREISDMASSELVRSALGSDPRLLEQEFGSYVSDCEDHESLKVRLGYLESMFPVGEIPFGSCISSGAMPTFCRVMEDDIASAERPDQLRSAVLRYTAPQGDDVPETLRSEEYRRKANEIALRRVADIVRSKLDGATDISEMSRMNEAYGMADILELTQDFRDWMRHAVREAAMRMASYAIANAPDYPALVTVFDDYRTSDPTGSVNDPEFKRMFVDRAVGFLNGYTDVRSLRDERRNGFTAPIDEELGFAVRSRTIDLMTRDMSECSDIQSLNAAMEAVRDESLLMELGRIYSKRAEGIIRSSTSIAEATAGYESLVERYVDLGSGSDEVCQAYCDRVVDLASHLGEGERIEASRDVNAASTLASTLTPRISDMPPGIASAWLSYFESDGTPETNETRAAMAALRRAASGLRARIGCTATAIDGRVHTFF